MNNKTCLINSIQTLGTLDGPGVRFVIFSQGCPLRCICCHNPETWDNNSGEEYTLDSLFQKIVKYKDYFGNNGGITVSGGEPLLQAKFFTELFKRCHLENINTCLDTSGCILNDEVRQLLKHTDYCLLDLKYTSNEEYIKYVGCEIDKPLEFLKQLNKFNIKTRVRQVIIKGLNDNKENIKRLKEICEKYPCVSEIELLPFRKLCVEKYKKQGIEFKLKNTPETSKQEIDFLKKYL